MSSTPSAYNRQTQTGIGLSYLDLALVISFSTIGLLLIMLTIFFLFQKYGCPPRKKNNNRKRNRMKRQRTKTQVRSLMLVTRELHKYYKDCEAQGIKIDEKQRKSHMRLQQRLIERKTPAAAIKEHKAVVAALQAHSDGFTANIGEALSKDVHSRIKENSTADIDINEDLEFISVDKDAAIDEMHSSGTFDSALDPRKSKLTRKSSSLKIMAVLHRRE